jgi:hypothetical protein
VLRDEFRKKDKDGGFCEDYKENGTITYLETYVAAQEIKFETNEIIHKM